MNPRRSALILHPNSDYVADLVVPSNAGGPANLTGASITPLGVTGLLAGRVTTELTNPAGGAIRLTLSRHASWVPGLLESMTFKIDQGGAETVPPPIRVYVRERRMRLVVARGQDWEAEFPWADGAGGVRDLTAATVVPIAVSPALSAALTVTVVNPAAGRVRSKIEVDDAWAGVVGTFQIARQEGGLQFATNVVEFFSL